jgi:2Fe-2S ferredoxin
VYVDESWTDAVGRATPIEASMLEFSSRRQPNSRLSCQIRLSDALDGLIVQVPDSQD